MTSKEPETKSEIIIVRRSGGDGEEEHHGGVWKIAYADFMTAMMAFFLVMWLINSANEETKAAVANYFNPLKLVDMRTRPRGVEDTSASMRSEKKLKEVEGEEKKTMPGNSAEGSKDAPEVEIVGTDEENRIMALPYHALNVIANNRTNSVVRYEGQGGASEGGLQSGSAEGTAYRDPFSPEYWDKNQAFNVLPATGDEKIPARPRESAGQAIEAKNKEHLAEPAEENRAVEGGKAAAETPEQELQPEKQAPEAIAAKEISSDVARLLQKEAGAGHNQPDVQVTATKDGVAIELTDSQSYGMFAVGSAKPDKHLVAVLEGVARILQKHKGAVVISGHTDARPYKTAHYDNWQLSSARAQMAYYMLVRGGLDEKRVLRVEGYADRDLKNSKDPHAAENRRISIFLKVAGTEAR